MGCDRDKKRECHVICEQNGRMDRGRGWEMVIELRE